MKPTDYYAHEFDGVAFASDPDDWQTRDFEDDEWEEIPGDDHKDPEQDGEGR